LLQRLLPAVGATSPSLVARFNRKPTTEGLVFTMTEDRFQNLDASEWGDLNVRFKNVRFGINPKYTDNDGNMPTCLIMDLETASGKVNENQMFSIGGGYVAVDGGASVEHERSKFNKPGAAFTKMSKGATLLESLVAIDGALDLLNDRADKTGGPRNAAFWEGMVAHLVEETVEFGKPGEDGKRKSFRQWVATELFGWDVEIPDEDDGDTPPPAAKLRTAADFNLDDDHFAQLVELVESSADYETFVSAAYSLPCIGEEAVQNAVDDDAKGVWSLKA
jgi:hypothetical protein